jgi:PhnB protein
VELSLRRVLRDIRAPAAPSDGRTRVQPPARASAAPRSAAAIDWYRDVFGAEEVSRMTGGAGRIAHAELRIGSSALFLGDEHVNYEAIHAPPRIGGSPVYLDIEADDVVELFDRAMAAGATAIRPPTDPSLPIQSAKIRDPVGHIWLITRTTPE